jgi:small-conductance mechanosensitive channel
MTPASFSYDQLLRSLSSTEGGIQLATLAFAFAFAWLLTRMVRSRVPDKLQPGLAKIGAGSVQRVVFPLLFLAIAWIAKTALTRYQPVPLMQLGVLLIGSFALIRLVFYLLRHALPVSPFLKSSERVVAFTVWGMLALYLTGILPEILSALDEVKFALGKQTVTLRMIIEAVLSAIVTVFIAMALSSVAERRIMRTETLDMSLRVVFSKVLRALALVIGVLIALPLVGIDLTLLSVFGGALGVGLGFGLQKIASNYVSGFIILLDRSVRLGDLVTVDNRHGVVESIRARYTVIKGFDGTQAIIPNDTLITNTVLNHAYGDRVVAVKVNVTISYRSDFEVARDIMMAAAKAHARVVAKPEPAFAVLKLGENGIDLELLVFITDPENGQGNLRSELLIEILRSFRAQGIEIPATLRDVQLRPASPLSSLSPLSSNADGDTPPKA